MTAIARTFWAGLAMLLAALPTAAREGAYFVPGDPKLGMQAFLEKGCVKCHSVLGEGGRSGPDLARAPAGYLSAAEVVAAMWNHAPSMWQRMRAEGFNPPKFTAQEMTNLFAFLYSVRSLDEPGDAERGRRLLAEKKCMDCHAAGQSGDQTAPNLRNWSAYRNPVSWIQAMWNHGVEMQKRMAARGLSWPQFKDSDMADIIAHVRTLGAAPRDRSHLRVANPKAGRELFQLKGCAACHPIRGVGGARGPDLGASPLPRTLGQFAALMWNHAPEMWNSMRARQIPRPEFSNQEMADLIAYLFTQRYFEASGNAERGRRGFEEKGCGSCHAMRGGEARGPSLAHWRGTVSAVGIAAALWNHGPMMLGSMQQRQIAWPRFRATEINDLMEYLGQGQPALQSAGGKK